MKNNTHMPNRQVGADALLLAGLIQSQGQNHVLGRSDRAASFLITPGHLLPSSTPHTALDSLPLGFLDINKK